MCHQYVQNRIQRHLLKHRTPTGGRDVREYSSIGGAPVTRTPSGRGLRGNPAGQLLDLTSPHPPETRTRSCQSCLNLFKLVSGILEHESRPWLDGLNMLLEGGDCTRTEVCWCHLPSEHGFHRGCMAQNPQTKHSEGTRT